MYDMVINPITTKLNYYQHSSTSQYYIFFSILLLILSISILYPFYDVFGQEQSITNKSKIQISLPGDFYKYSNSELGIEFKYNKDWKIEETANAIKVLSPTLDFYPPGILLKQPAETYSPAYLAISKTNLQNHTTQTLSKILDTIVSSITGKTIPENKSNNTRKITNLEDISFAINDTLSRAGIFGDGVERGNNMIDGNPAYQTAITFGSGKIITKLLMIFSLKDDDLILVSYYAFPGKYYPKYYSMAEETIKSIKLY